MSDTKQHEVVVIGAGPGGYRAAFMAADLGLQTTLIDPAVNPGGVCLYRGCIPTKALLHLAKVKSEAEHAEKWGLSFGEAKIDREKVKSWKESVVKQLTGGLGQLTKGRKINYIQGWAKFSDKNTLEVDKTDGGKETVSFKNLIIATGASPIKLPFIEKYTDRIMNAEIALELKSIPKSLLVIGGGYIGMESATIYKALGSKVTLVEAMPSIMPGMDKDLVQVYMRANKDLFEEMFFETFVTDLKELKTKVKASFKDKDDKTFEKDFDAVLLSIGMKPNSDTLALENAGVEKDEKGFIKVDEQSRTNVSNIFAIGDVSGGMLLAHKASYQGRIAAEVISGKKSAFDARAIPAVVYTSPEIATAGMSEEECKNKNIKYRVVKFPWTASGRALANGDTTGVTKLIVEEETERILGAGIVGANAGDLISEAVLGIEMAARVSDIGLSIHPHPTVSETLMEAAELYYGHPVHVAPTRKR
jgi:dihydrolipoamide dehydrogenase